jgi:2-(1,2-epoxy-1,2-dihydrophenyl)acetyl-CoA isomerase
MESPVLYDVAHGVATITLNRPEVRNAFDVPMLRLFEEAARRATSDPGVRAIVTTGAGGHFSGGGDVRRFREAAAEGGGERAASLIQEMTLYYHAAVSTLARAEKPWICAVDGTAAGGGFSLAIAGDLAIASERAVFVYAYSAIGLAPDGASSWSLPRLVGPKKALRIAYRNPRIGAAEALALGLIEEVHPAAEFEARWRAAAREIAAGPTRAFAATKRLVRQSLRNGLEEQMEDERAAIAACARSADFAEGIAAFGEKRPARFEGR